MLHTPVATRPPPPTPMLPDCDPDRVSVSNSESDSVDPPAVLDVAVSVTPLRVDDATAVPVLVSLFVVAPVSVSDPDWGH